MGILKILAVILWVILGTLNLTTRKRKINKGDYFICWILLIMWLTKDAISYFVSN